MEHPCRHIQEIEFKKEKKKKREKKNIKEEEEAQCSGYCTCFPSLTDRRPRSRTGKKKKKKGTHAAGKCHQNSRPHTCQRKEGTDRKTGEVV